MMKRHVRRFSRKFERKMDDVRSFATNLVRSNSDYHYTYRSTIPVPSSISDDEDQDPVFGAIESNESSTNDTRRTSITLLPCQYCSVQQSIENFDRHQRSCSQNTNPRRGRRNLTANNTTNGSVRRTASEIVPPPTIPRRLHSPKPSAPPRSRSSSPTEGFPIPNHLTCPITLKLFHDPVVATDGHTYERAAITNWLRTSKKSPITREDVSVDKLNPNRVVKQMADDFRAECQLKRSLYKYRLDIDLKKTEQLTDSKTNTKTIYQAEWIKTDPSSTNSKIILTHLTGENAEKLAEMNCQLALHPNIVQTYGRVEHKDTGILLAQEYLPEQTLAQLIKQSEQKLSITILDKIFYQIASALQHLANLGIVHGNVTADNVLIYQLDEIPEKILIKLTNIGDFEKSTNDLDSDKIAPEVLLSKDHYSEKSDVYTFGILARELYSLELATNDIDLIERQTLVEHCLVTDPDERPTFNELTKSIIDLIHQKKFVYPSLTE